MVFSTGAMLVFATLGLSVGIWVGIGWGYLLYGYPKPKPKSDKLAGRAIPISDLSPNSYRQLEKDLWGDYKARVAFVIPAYDWVRDPNDERIVAVWSNKEIPDEFLIEEPPLGRQVVPVKKAQTDAALCATISSRN